MKRKRRGFVSARDTGSDVIRKLSRAVTDLGGSGDDLRRLLTDKKLRIKVAELLVGSAPKTLAQMIVDAGLRPNPINGDIIDQHFPLDKEGEYDASALRLFGGDHAYTINEVDAAIKLEGGRLEGLVRGLAYLKENPEALKNGPIVFSATSWRAPDGRVYVPCVHLVFGEPWPSCLSWSVRTGTWDPHCRFLVS
jgi:hypothetical protein